MRNEKVEQRPKYLECSKCRRGFGTLIQIGDKDKPKYVHADCELARVQECRWLNILAERALLSQGK